MARLLSPINELHEIIAIAAILAVATIALWRGGPPHRAAAVVLLIDGFGLSLLYTLFHDAPLGVAGDAKAALVLVGYALITLRWPDRWIVALTALQGLAVFFHLARWMDLSIPASASGLVLNATGWLMLFILGAAALFAPRLVHAAGGRA